MVPVSLQDATEGALRAWQAAQQAAAAEGAFEVRPVHLFRALVQDPEAHPAQLLLACGLDTASWRPSPTPGPGEGNTAKLPPSADTDAALSVARTFDSDPSGVHRVSTQHLLLALLRTNQELREQLESQGLDWAGLEKSLRPPADEPLALESPLCLEVSPDEVATARVIDAAGNRAREALRVAEDYCRFVLSDRYLTDELKRLRHDLAALLARLPEHHALDARDTLADVGTELHTASEVERRSAAQVCRASFLRLGEALRSLEEFGKLCRPNLGPDIKQLRYLAYSLERAVVPGADRRLRLHAARLYLLVGAGQCDAAVDWTVAEAVAGGVDVVQLREKGLSDRELLDRARHVRRCTRDAGAVFIVNDRPDIARLAEADGVHLGQDDLGVHDARRTLGPDAIVGVSTHYLDQLRRAVLDGADYVAVGPMFASDTKKFVELPGPRFASAAIAETSLPAFAIGGISAERLPELVAAGVQRVAVCGAVCRSPDPRSAASALRRALDEHARSSRAKGTADHRE